MRSSMPSASVLANNHVQICEGRDSPPQSVRADALHHISSYEIAPTRFHGRPKAHWASSKGFLGSRLNLPYTFPCTSMSLQECEQHKPIQAADCSAKKCRRGVASNCKMAHFAQIAPRCKLTCTLRWWACGFIIALKLPQPAGPVNCAPKNGRFHGT